MSAADQHSVVHVHGGKGLYGRLGTAACMLLYCIDLHV